MKGDGRTSGAQALPLPSLSQDQIDDYFRDGYLLMPGLISQASIRLYNARFQALVQGEVALSEAMKIMQDVMVVKGAVQPTSALHAVNKLLCLENDAELSEYASAPEVVGVLRSLLGESIFSLSSNVFNKPPGVDGRHPLHQDLRYFKLRPADKIVGVWTAMLPATRKSGCLAVIPGSHTNGLLPHANPSWEFVNHGFYGITDVDIDARVHIEMEVGDTLFFHPLLVHGSGRNRSSDFRRAISAHFAAGDCTSEHENWHNRGLTRQVC